VVEERDADGRVDGKPAVLPGEHVGGGVRVEKPLPLEPADHAAAGGRRRDEYARRWDGRPGDCPVSERVSDQLVRLPFYTGMTEADQSRVIDAILAFAT
jgi:hypothetical protein